MFYIPGELGIRHEDTVGVTADVCGNLAPKVGREAPKEPRSSGGRLLHELTCVAHANML